MWTQQVCFSLAGDIIFQCSALIAVTCTSVVLQSLEIADLSILVATGYCRSNQSGIQIAGELFFFIYFSNFQKQLYTTTTKIHKTTNTHKNESYKYTDIKTTKTLVALLLRLFRYINFLPYFQKQLLSYS